MDANKYREMNCPVCENFTFTQLSDTDIEKEKHIQCPVCGWICDADQTDNPDLKEGPNARSLNENKQDYLAKFQAEIAYANAMESQALKPHLCPVCQEHMFEDSGAFEICPICGWDDDGLMEHQPDLAEGANDLSLLEYRQRWNRTKPVK
jgi:hypothetical protein